MYKELFTCYLVRALYVRCGCHLHLLLGGSKAQSGEMSCPRSEIINGRARPITRTLNLEEFYSSFMFHHSLVRKGEVDFNGLLPPYIQKVPLCLTILVFLLL